jgi:DNA-binding transcriptional ArsR family regulator
MTKDVFQAIADPNRRHLLEELRRQPQTVNELANGLPISRPAVSQH